MQGLSSNPRFKKEGTFDSPGETDVKQGLGLRYVTDTEAGYIHAYDFHIGDKRFLSGQFVCFIA